MKLRNKLTGEIKDVESLGHEKSLRDKYGPQITLSWNTEYENLGECRTYDSLAELNEEWEDVPEEPKEYWFIDWTSENDLNNFIDSGDEVDESNKSIGNYFETREEAEKAVEKLKAWKRLKDRGFRFESFNFDRQPVTNAMVNLIIKATFNEGYDKDAVKLGDLDLLFSGGEE